MLNRILIFNPSTDYALASGSSCYTPPASVRALTESMALLPASFGLPGDIILVPENTHISSDDIKNADEKKLHIVKPGNLKKFISDSGRDFSDFYILPWGWNLPLRRELADIGVPVTLLPSEEWIADLRRLSHRRSSIRFNNLANSMLNDDSKSPLPIEFFDEESALEWLDTHNPAFFKAPWSSSGRGILFTPDAEPAQVASWIKGIIRQQGSVIAEEAADKLYDFATEWFITDNPQTRTPEAHFIGLSFFRTSFRGKYQGNMEGSQEEISLHMKRCSIDLNDNMLNIQKSCLEDLAGSYRGFCGIDMLSDKSGSIRICIEINWRLTMGCVSILKQNPRILERFRELHKSVVPQF